MTAYEFPYIYKKNQMKREGGHKKLISAMKKGQFWTKIRFLKLFLNSFAKVNYPENHFLLQNTESGDIFW